MSTYLATIEKIYLRKDKSFFYNTFHAGVICLYALAFFLPISTAMTNILFYLIAIMVITSCNNKYIYQQIINNKAGLILIGYFILFTIGLTYSQEEGITKWVTWKKYLKFILAPFFLCLLNDEKIVKKALLFFLASMCLVCLLGYLKAFDIIYVSNRLAGSTSVFKHHIQTNILIAFTAYIFLVLAKWNTRHRIWHIILFLAFGYNCIFLGTGRTGYIIFFTLCMYFILRNINWKYSIFLMVSLLCIPIITYKFSENFQNRIDWVIKDIQQYQDNDAYTSTGLRISFLLNGIKIIKNNPIYGSGTGSIGKKYQEIEANKLYHTNNPHNEFINTTIQIGYIGLTYLIMMLIFHWIIANKIPHPYSRYMEGVILAITVGCLGNSLLKDTTESHFYAFFIILFASLYPLKTKRSTTSLQ